MIGSFSGFIFCYFLENFFAHLHRVLIGQPGYGVADHLQRRMCRSLARGVWNGRRTGRLVRVVETGFEFIEIDSNGLSERIEVHGLVLQGWVVPTDFGMVAAVRASLEDRT